MGMVYANDRDWPNAEKSFRRAIELNAALTQTYTSFAFSTLGPLEKLDEAERLLRTALRSDPLSLDVRRQLAIVDFQAVRYEQAIAELQRIRSIDPEFPFADGFLGRALTFAGRSSEAIPLLQHTGEGGEQFLALAYVLAGRRAEAEKLATVHRGYPIREARIYAALGDKDRAFEALERAVINEPFRVALLLAYPEMATLRSDPRFEVLRRRLNLPADVALDRP
jgi:tetratricopeptide (TPR) repeat protein